MATSSATSSTSSTPSHDLLAILGQIEHTDLPILCDTMKQALEPMSDFTNVFQQDTRMGRMADAGSHVFQTIEDTANNIKSQISGRDSENGISLILSNVLEQVGKSHYLATALSITAAAMKSYRAYSNNKALCIDLLKSMVELVDALTNLPQDLQSSDEMYLKDISRVIILSALKMQSMSKACKAKRFIFALINQQDLKNIQQKLRDVFQNLNVRVSISIRSNLNQDQYHNFVPSNPEAVRIDATIEDVVREVGMGKLRSQCICICLHGMGGAGKSTIADAVYHKLMEDRKLEGYAHCRLELDLQEERETMKERQRELLEKMTGKKCSKIGNPKDGIEMIRHELNKLKELKKPVFLLLDNLLQPRDVGLLVLDGSMYDLRSVFVVTTRDQGIGHELEKLKLNVVKKAVLPLKEEESRSLLYHSMGCAQQDVDESLRTTYEKKILKTCGGLPLALKLVGGYIGTEGQNEQDVWEWAVNSLVEGTSMTADNSMDERMSLRFSIDSLNPILKKSFLDVISFYNGMEWTFDFQCVIGKQELQRLEKRHLIQRKFVPCYGWFYDPITQTTTKTIMRVQVHDILLGLGLNILENDLMSRSITNVAEFDSLPADFDSMSCKIRGIWLNERNPTLPANVLCQMPDIRFLVNVKMEDKCNKELTSLKKCSLLGGFLGSSMPLALMKATNLKSLEVKYLNMAGEQLPNNMKILSLISSPSIQNLEQFKSKNLEFLRLDGCPELESLDGIEHPCSLKHLIISNCQKLREVVIGGSSLTALENLQISTCSNLEHFKFNMDSAKLRCIIIKECKKLKELPSGYSGVHHLEVSDCDNITALPQQFNSQQDLRYISLSNCSSLSHLPDGFLSDFPKLQELCLDGCQGLTSLPDLQQHHSHSPLNRISLENCSNLCHLPDGFFVAFPNLEYLYLNGCQGLTSFPSLQQHHSHPSLKWIFLVNCSSLPHLPDGFFVAFPNLESINLNGCQGLTSFPDLQQHYSHPSLKEISLENCSNLLHLPDGFFVGFPNLEDLYLDGCQGLTSFPSLQQHHSHPSLKYISLINCSNLPHLPDGFFVAFPKLENLYLNGCQGLTSFPDLQQHHSHPSLKVISLKNCSSLPHLPDGFFVAFPNLQKLDLDGCQGLKSLPTPPQHHSHSSLKVISLINCSNLLHLPDGFFVAFPNLEILNLYGCQGLTSLPTPQQHYLSLKILILKNCSNLSQLPDGFRSAFPNLRNSLANC